MDKLERARNIMGQVLSMNRSKGAAVRDNEGNTVRNLRHVAAGSFWNATVTLEAAAGDPTWETIHLHSDGELKFAVRRLTDDLDIIAYRPGQWELWFNTFVPGDTDEIFPITAR